MRVAQIFTSWWDDGRDGDDYSEYCYHTDPSPDHSYRHCRRWHDEGYYRHHLINMQIG